MLSRSDAQVTEGMNASRPSESLSPVLILLILGAILLVAGYLRFTGLNWGEGQYIHPDEGHMRNTLSLITWPDDLSLYFDTHHSPLNVRNEGRQYSYGTLPLFLVRAVAEWLDRACASGPAPVSRAAATVLIGPDVNTCRPGTFTGAYNAVVGRTLSAFSDLGTLILIYLIGRRLYGEVTGLVAAGLGAVTAFLIQQAHFFTVDSMACFFLTSVVYFSVRAAQAGRSAAVPAAKGLVPSPEINRAGDARLGSGRASVLHGAPSSRRRGSSDARLGSGRAGLRTEAKLRVRWVDFALAGIGLGLAAACKVSAATAALLVVLAAVQVALRYVRGGVRRSNTDFELSKLWPLLIALSVAGTLSLIAFRIAQPYAFEGPGFFGVRPSPEWFGRLHEIRVEQAGEVDLPSGRQWANRSPILFPWLNIVVWGMGLPLGLAGWIGWGVAGFELLAGTRRGQRHLALWGWSTVLFLYHATRWVKSMRYFLPLYPILLIFAAAWLVRLCSPQEDRLLHPGTARIGVRSSLRRRRWAGVALSVVVVLGAIFWGFACFAIYRQPHPRVAASRWIYEHVPEGVTVANEHWDWGLPLRVDGHDPFGGMYTGIEMQNYNEDTVQKRQQLYEWLDKADWIFLASNRLYASIPRLPSRYPLTTEYYRALFAGELGFELEADFTSYPALGPFIFPDQENPFPLARDRPRSGLRYEKEKRSGLRYEKEKRSDLMEADYVSQMRPIEVRLPPAEEAFSVYDHPRVLIFRKTEAYSSQMVKRVLGDVELDRVQLGRTPREATKAPNMLRFDDAVWAEQQAGGTWSEMFNRDSLLNRHPGLAALAWWASVTILGWLTFPLLFASLPWLRDRGYGFARLLGLLLIAYLTWLAASIRLFPNSRPTIVRMIALLGLTGVGVGWLRWHDMKAFLRRRWRVVLAAEGLFALLFFLWIGVRMLQPDLWHPVVGGEKPMDFAYLNAVMKSTWFPPYNPWLSGTWINYYYFGFVIVGTLIKLVGTVPPIAYNLTVPLIFALTGLGAFSIAYDLSGPRPHMGKGGEGSEAAPRGAPSSRRQGSEATPARVRARRRDGDHQRALFAGLAALVFTVLMGNLGVVHLIRNKLIALGNISFPSTIPGLPSTVSFLQGLWRVILGQAHLVMRPETWYWHPTRIIPAEAGNPIAEFPAFTFLYGDLHAHMIAFPLTLFAMALALAWARASQPRWGSLLLGGLVIGALRPTNTWDYPTYLLLGVLALGLGAWRARGGQSGGHASGPSGSPPCWGGLRGGGKRSDSLVSHMGAFVRRVAWRIPALVGLTVLLYLPYIRTYVTGYDSFKLWEGEGTPVAIYLWIYGMLLFPLVTWLVVNVAERVRHERIPWVITVAVIGAMVIGGVALWMLGVAVGLVAVPIIVLAGVLFFLGDQAVPPGDPPVCTGMEDTAPGRGRGDQLLWLVVSAAMMLSIAVEVLVLEGDIGRMNTVFKFYLQVWVLLSIAAAVSLAWIWRRSRQWETSRHRLWWGVMAALTFGGSLFLPFGVRARAIDRMAPETGLTLNGMAFMEDALIDDGPEGDLEQIALSGDYHAIRWMQENVEGSPVILEGLGRREYLWANRVSIYTGLPAVVGWRWHQVQQRAGVGGEMVNWRRDDVNACYETANVARAMEIMERYGVRYVYVGAYERAYYSSAGLDAFDRMVERGLLRVVYDAAGVKIYEMVV